MAAHTFGAVCFSRAILKKYKTQLIACTSKGLFFLNLSEWIMGALAVSVIMEVPGFGAET